MGKIVKLTELELRQIVQNIIGESKRHSYMEQAPVNENKKLSEKGINTLKRKIESDGSRSAAHFLLNAIIKKEFGGMSSDDLPDTAEFADTLDEMDDSLSSEDFSGALSMALDYVSTLKYDMGYGDKDMDEEEQCDECGSGNMYESTEECPKCGNTMETTMCECGYLNEELG